MTKPKPISSYKDCEEHYERALESPKGIEIKFEQRWQATRYRARLHKYRVLLRAQNEEVYPFDHPMHGSTPYENLIASIPKDEPPRIRLAPEYFGAMKVTEIKEEQEDD